MSTSMNHRSAAALVATWVIASASPAWAANPRSFVSASGNDANTCSVLAPCRTFTKALAETVSDGEIVVMNAAGYGVVTIAQSVTITGLPGAYAGITANAGENGITVMGGRVSLRGLTISTQVGPQAGSGIVVQAGTVYVENCHVTGFTANNNNAAGLTIAGGSVNVKDSIFQGNRNGVVTLASAVVATFDRVQAIDSVMRGFDLNAGRIAIRDSIVSGNANNGIYVANGSPTTLTLDRSIISSNGNTGVVAGDDGPALVTITGSVVAGNGITGLFAANTSTMIASGNTIVRNGTNGILLGSSGTFLSAGNNIVSGNPTDVSGTITPLSGR